ncbi:MAG: hypothetical protein PHI84_12375 [Kiritimatiellae bacterium]|nr:hypothetical protein [Kiritimatiellia bacterium]
MGDTGITAFVDLSRTPLSSIANDSCFVAAEATRLSATTGQVDIVRYDPQDEKVFNRDRYDVAENLSEHPQFDRMVDMSDTHASPQLVDYLRNNVFLTKIPSQGQPWHWQDECELSQPVRMQFYRRANNTQEGIAEELGKPSE